MTSDEVTKYLEEINGRKIRAQQIARKFKTSVASVNIVLTKCTKVESEVIEKRKVYFVRTKEEVELREEQRKPSIKEQKRDHVYKPSQTMLDNIAKARQGRPDGFGFVTIS